MFATPISTNPKIADLVFAAFSTEHNVTLTEHKFYDIFFQMNGFRPSPQLLQSKLFLSFDANEHLIKLKVEREDICVFSKKCDDPRCALLHNIRKMDYCRSFTSFDGCPRKHECPFLHVPSMRLCDRVVSVFGWRGSRKMSETDFVDQHARVYPYDHQPAVELLHLRLPFIRLSGAGDGNGDVFLDIDLDRDICKSWLSNCCSLKRSCRYLHPKYYCREFAAHKTCRKYPHCPFWHIAGKFISPPPSRLESLPRSVLVDGHHGLSNPHVAHKSVVLTNLDERWEDDTLISDIRLMFQKHGFKVVDIFMRGRIRLAFVQLGSESQCKVCIDTYDDQWCFNRIVRVERAHRGENRICIKTLNSEVVDREVKHWLEPLNLKVQRVCIEEKFSFGSNIAFIFLQSQDECDRAISELHQSEELRGHVIGVEHPRSVPLIHQLPLRHTNEPDNWVAAQKKNENEFFDEFDQRSMHGKKKRALRNPANVQTSHPSFRNSRLRKEIRRGSRKSVPPSIISNSSGGDVPLDWNGDENMFMVEDTKDMGFVDETIAGDYPQYFGYENEYSTAFTVQSLSPRPIEAEDVKENGWFEGDAMSTVSVPELPPDARHCAGDRFWDGYMCGIAEVSAQRSYYPPQQVIHVAKSVAPSVVPSTHSPFMTADYSAQQQHQQQQQHQHHHQAKTGMIPTPTQFGRATMMNAFPAHRIGLDVNELPAQSVSAFASGSVSAPQYGYPQQQQVPMPSTSSALNQAQFGYGAARSMNAFGFEVPLEMAPQMPASAPHPFMMYGVHGGGMASDVEMDDPTQEFSGVSSPHTFNENFFRYS